VVSDRFTCLAGRTIGACGFGQHCSAAICCAIGKARCPRCVSFPSTRRSLRSLTFQPATCSLPVFILTRLKSDCLRQGWLTSRARYALSVWRSHWRRLAVRPIVFRDIVRAHILLTGHIFCRSCLEEYIDKLDDADKAECPTCRVEFPLGASTFGGGLLSLSHP
jgi:hypothetical protein